MGFSHLKGFWSDAGTFESLLRASVMVRGLGGTDEATGAAGSVASEGLVDLSSSSLHTGEQS